MQRFLPKISLLLLATICGLSLSAQNRFIDEVFTEVEAEFDVTYASNISILTGTPALEELKMDVYQPAGDSVDNILRPVVVIWPTGNFLPAYINQGPYGTRKDSANVEIANRLVARGFVVMIASYRSGWLPTAEDLETRTGTLLRAAYRGGQDAHAMSRFLRKTVVEDDNLYQVDTSRIVYWGIGTGGYVTMTHAFLDSYDEILSNDQFYDADGDPLVVEEVDSNPQGTTATFFAPNVPSNVPNYPEYSSDVAMSINGGGAMGDPAWIDGGGNEPMVLGYHAVRDPFAPFYEGTVIVPTTDETVVSGVAGTNQILEIANANGLNDAIASANGLPLAPEFPALSSVVNTINGLYAAVPVSLGGLIPTATSDTFPLSRDNMYTWTEPTGSLGVLGTPYHWFDTTTLKFIVSQFPVELGLDADAIIAGEGLTNPNFANPEKARTYIDTMMAHFIPRAYIGLDLANPSLVTSTEELVQAGSIGLRISPNPATDYLLIETEEDHLMREVTLFDISGRPVANFRGVDNNQLRIERGDYPTGQYIVRIRVDEGVTARQVFLR